MYVSIYIHIYINKTFLTMKSLFHEYQKDKMIMPKNYQVKQRFK